MSPKAPSDGAAFASASASAVAGDDAGPLLPMFMSVTGVVGTSAEGGTALGCASRSFAPSFDESMASAKSAGESCQFQKRVRSIFSHDWQQPRTASPSMPWVGSVMRDFGGTNAWRWNLSRFSCTSREVVFISAASTGGMKNGITMLLPKNPIGSLAMQLRSGTSGDGS